ncbi:hypothetical protein BASA81_008104 [Batrachochytrium salamandrivorans]|nr:hypothetical protein BASA81_008104 [Batrachochytrium salamandrivorans]
MRAPRLQPKREPKGLLIMTLTMAIGLVLFIWRLRSSSSATIAAATITTTTAPPLPLPTNAVLEYFSSQDCNPTTLLESESLDEDEDESKFPYRREATRSIRLISDMGYAEFTTMHGDYLFSLFALDGCVTMYDSRPGMVKLFAKSELQQEKQIPQEKLDILRSELLDGELPMNPHAKYRVVFSCESKEYFGYQTWVNRLAFSRSQQGQDATWTRLLTCHEPDDIAQLEKFPTFTAHRHPFSDRYGPINKPDIITKWFSSADAPQEEVIMVIDPDSWLLLPVYDQYITKIKPGFAIGQEAYYTGSRTAQLLWKELCEINCDLELDLVGVPYVIHREDLRVLAPLWKYYVLKIKHRLETTTEGYKEFTAKYGKLDVNWASEMFGYNLAAAHLGIHHDIVKDLQIRDVDGGKTFERAKNKASLHMGRAWFPKGHPAAKPWLHTEGKPFANFGDQVWCKCNYTASTIKPWPIPQGLDFVSHHTLTLLHDADVEYGPVPNNQEFRRNRNVRYDYGWAHP